MPDRKPLIDIPFERIISLGKSVMESSPTRLEYFGIQINDMRRRQKNLLDITTTMKDFLETPESKIRFIEGVLLIYGLMPDGIKQIELSNNEILDSFKTILEGNIYERAYRTSPDFLKTFVKIHEAMDDYPEEQSAFALGVLTGFVPFMTEAEQRAETVVLNKN